MSIQNPLTFLELCQRTQLECGISGAQMTTTVGATGEALRITTWVSSAVLEIQEMHPDYDFLRASVSFVTDTSKTSYTETDCGLTAGRLGMWARDTFRTYLTSGGVNGEIFTPYVPYEQWRDNYFIGAMRSVRAQPIYMTITPSKSLAFGPIAANGYTVVGDYFLTPRPLVNDADTLSSVIVAAGGTALQGNLPHLFSMAIVGHVMMTYGAYENAPEVYNRGELWFNHLVTRLAAERLPEVSTGGALA